MESDEDGTLREDMEPQRHVWVPSIGVSGMLFYTAETSWPTLRSRASCWPSHSFDGCVYSALAVAQETAGDRGRGCAWCCDRGRQRLAGRAIQVAAGSAAGAIRPGAATIAAVVPAGTGPRHRDLARRIEHRLPFDNGIPGGTVCAVRGINDLTPRVLGGTGGREPFMSPDGRWLGYQAAGELRKMSMTGGPPNAIATLASPLRGVHWGADDRIVFGVVDPSTVLQSIPASGGEPRVLTTPARDKGEIGHYYPFTMPDGKAVLFTIGSGPDDNGQIAALDLQTGRYKTLIRGGGMPSSSSRGTWSTPVAERSRRSSSIRGASR